MANYEIPTNPTYSEAMRKLESTDPASAELFNTMFQQMLNNFAAISKGTTPVGNADKLDGAHLSDIQGWTDANYLSKNGTATNATQLGGKSASEYVDKFAIGAVRAEYRIFARFNHTMNNEPETMLISGGGDFSNIDGLWAVSFVSRQGYTLFTARELLQHSGNITFGYYTEGSYTYFGAYVDRQYSSKFFINKLDGNSALYSIYGAEYGEFYTGTTEPNGWTTVATHKFTIDTDLANYALQSAVNNIHTTSLSNPSTFGWYRVAEVGCGGDGSTHDCDIVLRTGFANTFPEYARLRVRTLHNLHEIVAVDRRSYNSTPLLIKARLTTDTKKTYLEVYYSSGATNPLRVEVSNSMSAYVDSSWKAINATPTAETVSGVTVLTTYDIPANSKPATSVDLANYLPKTEHLKVEHGNEVNFKGLTGVEGVYFNYRNGDSGNVDTTTPIKWYCFGDKNMAANGNIMLDMGAGSGQRYILHTGNSNAVKIQSSAPTDTSALWVW